MNTYLYLVLVTLLPWVECRGSIPIAVALNLNLLISILLIFVSNILIFPITFFVLKFFYDDFLSKYKIVRKIVEKVRRNGKEIIDKYGYLGLTLFVGIPLPFTGMYSGTILAWLFGMEFKKSFIYTSIGVLIATTIVTLISGGTKIFLFG